MKNYLKVDVANSRLVMDRTFAKNCAIAGSAEYNLLQAARKDYPNFTVEQRTIKRNANKECYHSVFDQELLTSMIQKVFLRIAEISRMSAEADSQ